MVPPNVCSVGRVFYTTTVSLQDLARTPFGGIIHSFASGGGTIEIVLSNTGPRVHCAPRAARGANGEQLVFHFHLSFSVAAVAPWPTFIINSGRNEFRHIASFSDYEHRYY